MEWIFNIKSSVLLMTIFPWYICTCSVAYKSCTSSTPLSSEETRVCEELVNNWTNGQYTEVSNPGLKDASCEIRHSIHTETNSFQYLVHDSKGHHWRQHSFPCSKERARRTHQWTVPRKIKTCKWKKIIYLQPRVRSTALIF